MAKRTWGLPAQLVSTRVSHEEVGKGGLGLTQLKMEYAPVK
ncbi:MAG: hypothetical protein ACYDA9_19585 [Terriglobia bacterium]